MATDLNRCIVNREDIKTVRTRYLEISYKRMINRQPALAVVAIILSVVIFALGLYLSIKTCGYKTVYQSQCMTMWSVKQTVSREDRCFGSIWCLQGPQNNTYLNVTLFKCDNTFPECWTRWSYYITNPNGWTGFSYTQNELPSVQELSSKETINAQLCVVGIVPLPFAFVAVLVFSLYIHLYHNCFDISNGSQTCWSSLKKKICGIHPPPDVAVTRLRYDTIADR
jgi:hypothetical protein